MRRIQYLFFLIFLASCAPLSQPSPTPDMAALATQMFVQLSVQETLSAAALPTPTPQPPPTPTPLWRSTPIPTPVDVYNYPPVFNPIDQMELVYVPAGKFIMGASPQDSHRDQNEEPQHTVYLDAFWISKTQVTNSMFNACINLGACQYSVSHTTNPRYLDPFYSLHPVVYISWEMAQTYCAWTGGRLPTEAEWEKAARGTAGARYPWGEEHPSLKLVNAGEFYGTTTQVGMFPYGRSPYGALDMGSNVREWVFDWYDPSYYQYSPSSNPMGPETGEKKVLKGACYSDEIRYCRPSNRLAHEPDSPGAVRGFRCVYP